MLSPMRLRLNEPALVPDLIEFLQSTPDVVVDVVGEGEVEVSLIGSYALDAMRMELYLRVRAWEAARAARGVAVELVDGP
jgi:hypothetical protein